MPQTYTNPRYPYRRSPDQDRETHHGVVVVGAGVVGLTLALDLAKQGVPVLVLDDDDTVAHGSRAICWSRRSLEIYDRLGLADRVVKRGVTWDVGRVFHRDRQVLVFSAQTKGPGKQPQFVNLQQYLLEQMLVEALAEQERAELRWKNRVVAVVPEAGGVRLTVETPEGSYRLTCEWLVACDGARSPVRSMLDLPFEGRSFRDRFLIADVVMEADFPAERRFWFDPPFHPGRSALLHKQADCVWRLDFQLDPDADPELEARPERVEPRVRAMLGPERPFSLEWVSVYSFKCRRLARFRHGRVLFAGDAAHQVSPFGARGGNGGIQDADNLAWKLAAVLRRHASESLLDSYDAERIPAAEENILHSSRATDFITPKTRAAEALRDAVLELSESCNFAVNLINSGRLSTPHSYRDSPLSTPDSDEWRELEPAPGTPAEDEPVLAPEGNSWLLRHLGTDFVALTFASAKTPVAPTSLRGLGPTIRVLPILPPVGMMPVAGQLADGFFHSRRDLPGTTYLFRPDQHVAARFRRFDPALLRAARDRALGRPAST